jgi:2-dehydro-3-deoxyphosphogluconate aldolase/(4S)-4-hydroxy-2-oxoglutarate aldolase
MNRKQIILDLVIEQGMLPVFFHADADVSVQILKALYKAGSRVVEYTNRDANALNNFLHLRKIADKDFPGLKLGVGRIRNKIEATEFINEGADFIVCPGVSESVAVLAERNNLLWVPGCLTATEISTADDLGAQLVQLFPGNLLGPSYLASLKEIFPDMLFMPTGDVQINEESIDSWFKSGAVAVNPGSKLISNDLLKEKDYTTINSLTKQTLQLIQKSKKGLMV